MINKKYLRILFVVYLLILLRVIVFKYPLERLQEIVASWRSDVLWEGMDRANFVWFRTIKMYVHYWGYKSVNSFGNLVGNILVFIPLGYMLPRLSRAFQNILICLGTGLLVVLAIELFQLLTAFGSFDVDDILLNELGILLGYLFYKMLSYFISNKSLTE
ncbi:MAG: VanZ family protein [Lachnospiraceae bacterium]|nr:VanZ family protein [Lachnospiraceae bacterium]